MKRLRIFVDANVLFSACNRGSQMNRMLSEAMVHYELVTCIIAIEEAFRNLARKKPDWLEYLVIFKSGLVIVPEGRMPDELNLPTIDGILLGAAVAADCDIFLTGDRHHFGRFFGKTIAGVRVLDPHTFGVEYAR